MKRLSIGVLACVAIGLAGCFDPSATQEDEAARAALYAAFDELAPTTGSTAHGSWLRFHGTNFTSSAATQLLTGSAR